MRWDEYIAEQVTRGQHRTHRHWKPSGVWEFVRADGLRTAHKAESPFPSWRETVERSMARADAPIPLGAPLPEGMRDRDDPDYGPLWDALSIAVR